LQKKDFETGLSLNPGRIDSKEAGKKHGKIKGKDAGAKD
jgi:hypothetical protein